MLEVNGRMSSLLVLPELFIELSSTNSEAFYSISSLLNDIL